MEILSGFKCNACGSTDFTFAHNPPHAEDIMTCEGCKREFGTLAEVRAMAEQHLQANAATINAQLNKKLNQNLDS